MNFGPNLRLGLRAPKDRYRHSMEKVKSVEWDLDCNVT